ncbi:MAG: hypothetical protein K2Q10_08795 [Rhodospirillales bacterium]|nr:hypothetical protein [Rhodospirillales bacterium]
MNKTLRTMSQILLLAVPLLAVSACKQDGPAEKAGAAIDNAAQQVKDAVNPPGPLEKAGRAVDKATQ